MGLDDCFAQRQSNAQPIGLAGRQRQNAVFNIVARKTGAGIDDRDLDKLAVCFTASPFGSEAP
jgi:hypothetical protein